MTHEAVENRRAGQRDAEVEAKYPPILEADVVLKIEKLKVMFCFRIDLRAIPNMFLIMFCTDNGILVLSSACIEVSLRMSCSRASVTLNPKMLLLACPFVVQIN